MVVSILVAALALNSLPSDPPPLVSPEPAQEMAAPALGSEAPPSWSLGAGTSISATSLFNPTALSFVPALVLTAEHRQSATTWLQFGLLGMAQNSQQTPGSVASSLPEGEGGGTGTSESVEAMVGLRKVLNPAGLIEVSLYWDLAAYYGHSNQTTLPLAVTSSAGTFNPLTVDQTSFGTEATAGVSLEKQLTSRLALRLGMRLIEVGYGRFIQGSVPAGEIVEGSGTGYTLTGGFSPSPSLSLVMYL